MFGELKVPLEIAIWEFGFLEIYKNVAIESTVRNIYCFSYFHVSLEL